LTALLQVLSVFVANHSSATYTIFNNKLFITDEKLQFIFVFLAFTDLFFIAFVANFAATISDLLDKLK